MLKSTSNRGRPKSQYKPKFGGDPIIGLMRLKDGRWRVSGPDKITFTEPDEKLAIARFRQIEARLKGAERVMLPVGTANVHEVGPLVKKALNRRIEIRIPRDPSKGVTVSHSFDTDEAWAWFRQQLLTQPKYVAQRIGIEQIGYLQNIKEPKPLPTFETLEHVWEQHFNSSAEQKRKCRAAFEDFREATGVTGIDGITPDVVVAYRDVVYSRKLTGKSQSNLFTRLRRYLSCFRDRAIAIDEINKALGYLALLTPNETTVTLDPQPIDPADWRKLLAKAEGDDKAMILLMLNCAMYAAEVIRLEWSDIRDGCLNRTAEERKCLTPPLP